MGIFDVDKTKITEHTLRELGFVKMIGSKKEWIFNSRGSVNVRLKYWEKGAEFQGKRLRSNRVEFIRFPLYGESQRADTMYSKNIDQATLTAFVEMAKKRNSGKKENFRKLKR